MNLGTPSAPTTKAIRGYLREFLSDRRVVELPRLLWWPILYGPLLTLRPRRLARAYAKMWERFGDSPLRVISRQQVEALTQRLDAQHPNAQDSERTLVAYAFTYGEPALSTVVDELSRRGVEQVLVLPLYPQFSATSTGAIYDQVAALFQRARDIPSIGIVKQYNAHPLYIEALARSVEKHWATHGAAKRLLISFHGIPQRNVDRGDPYFAQCQVTAQSLAARLQLQPTQWQVSFQSRLGRAQWLQPYTAATLQAWGREQLASMDIICPAFAADCLETLEEIAEEGRHLFQSAGGGEFRYIPALNSDPEHIDLMQALIDAHLPGSAN